MIQNQIKKCADYNRSLIQRGSINVWFSEEFTTAREGIEGKTLSIQDKTPLAPAFYFTWLSS